MSTEEVLDIIFSIRNRCEIIQLLSQNDVPSLPTFLHTLCEDNFIDCQLIVEGFCVEDDG